MEFVVAPVLFVVLVLFVAWPLLKETPEVEENSEPTDLDLALEEKDLAVENLKDIEMDYRMGKLSDEDYTHLKEDYEERAVNSLQAVESLRKKKRK